MSSTEDEMTAEEKTNRIETLLHELHSRQYRTYLEIQFGSRERMYQSYPDRHNIIGLKHTQREAVQEIIDRYGLQIENRDAGGTPITAFQKPEPTAENHKKILDDIIFNGYEISYDEATLAFLESEGPDSVAPLLWTDL